MLTGTRLAVWGDPIAHSRSPELHAAAYAHLGLDWSYGRRRVSEAMFPGELNGLDDTWRGLSLTMPLKGAGAAVSTVLDRRAELTGAANTLLRHPDGLRGFNTDVGGIVRALADDAVTEAPRARVIGAGATATSALVALSELSARHVEVLARRPDAAAPLVALGRQLGITVTATPFTASALEPVPLTIATLPGDAAVPGDVADALAGSGGMLLDVVYGHWPTALSSAWERAGAPARSGLGMLLHQAVLQVRVFVHGAPDRPLDDESAVVAEMQRALVGG